MNPIHHQLEFLTPCFSTGAERNAPEIRAASIRGQLHLWFRLLGFSFEAERRIFGGIGVQTAARTLPEHASPLVVRVGTVRHFETGSVATLPHKTGGPAASKPAFLPGTAFDLHILNRFDRFSSADELAVGHTLAAWYLCGALGLRSGRGGGAFTARPEVGATGACSAEITTLTDWNTGLGLLPGSRQFGAAVLGETYATSEAARKVITNTIGGPDPGNNPINLGAINYPLGTIHPQRKTSPLRMTVRRFGRSYQIVASWDRRQEVTGNTPNDLRSAVTGLEQRGKPLARPLGAVLDSLLG